MPLIKNRRDFSRRPVGFEGLGYSEQKSEKLARQLNREVSSRLVRKLLNDGEQLP